jgi:chromosome segregation ATPase
VKQETINKEIYEIKNTAQEIKEEFNKDMQNLRKKSDRNPGNKISFNQKKKNTVKSHSSKLERVEDRISGIKDKIDIKQETEEFLDKTIKSHERNTQDLSDSIKR